MNVLKTLVIGLGSTGTEICDAIASRIRWELGATERAPWIRFLTIETNSNTSAEITSLSGIDFMTLMIPKNVYQTMLSQPEAYDEAIDFSTWADTATLRGLPGNEVTAGAGNIRMVGRLAFLYPSNYENVKNAVVQRLQQLRDLTAPTAQEQRGPLQDGSNPEITFVAPEDGGDDDIRIIVVGTLCGGTSSGLAADFGYFIKGLLNNNAQQNTKSMAFFSIPSEMLTSAVVKPAEKFKKNAYHALKELNHYHNAQRDSEREIRFPDGIKGNPGLNIHPYDALYLIQPDDVGPEYTDRLNNAVADRVFMNAFAVETDPFGNLVDTAPYDRKNRSHAFCTF
ncbi:MAG TPA: tubulin-like doman-containing protein, partial [Armatimonadota bacterium]|nr:tubulin-like doman-containing protein [Armatimonadota bacterium]